MAGEGSEVFGLSVLGLTPPGVDAPEESGSGARFGTEGAGASVTDAVGISIEFTDGYSKGKGGALGSLGAGGVSVVAAIVIQGF